MTAGSKAKPTTVNALTPCAPKSCVSCGHPPTFSLDPQLGFVHTIASADRQHILRMEYICCCLGVASKVVAGCASDDEEGAGLIPLAHTASGGAPRARWWQGDRLRLRRLRLPETDDRPAGAGAAARHYFVEIGRSAGDLPFCRARVQPRTV